MSNQYQENRALIIQKIKKGQWEFICGEEVLDIDDCERKFFPKSEKLNPKDKISYWQEVINALKNSSYKEQIQKVQFNHYEPALVNIFLNEGSDFKATISFNEFSKEAFIAAMNNKNLVIEIYETEQLEYKFFVELYKVTKNLTTPISYRALQNIVDKLSDIGTKTSDKYYPLQHNFLNKIIRGSLIKHFDIEVEYSDNANLSLKNTLENIKKDYSIVADDSHHFCETSSGLHFNAIKVTDSNIDLWRELGKENSSKQNDVGISSFFPALSSYDNLNTEVWVICASTKPIKDLEKDKSSIEMFVTATTSENAPFSSHMGISRASTTYKGEAHKNISVALHSFGAHFMLQRHAEKQFVITNPAEVMREILIKAMEGKPDSIFIGDSSTKAPTNTLDKLTSEVVSATTKWGEILRSYPDPSYPPNLVLKTPLHKAKLDLAIKRQEDMVQEGLKRPTPVNFVKHKLFQLKDENDQIILHLDLQKDSPLNKELSWFTGHPHQLNWTSDLNPLITIELDALGRLFHFEGTQDL